MVPQTPTTPFFAKVAAARTAPFDYSSAGDPDGTRAHAFVSGLYEALQKEAGLNEAAACGFLRALAELGGSNDKHAFLDNLKVDPGAGWASNLGQFANARWQELRHPVVSTQAINIANHTPLTRTVTNDVYGGHYGDAAGHVAGGIWDAVKAHLPQSVGQFGDEAKQWLGQNVTPDNLKAIAPHVMAGLGTYAAGRMLGMGNVGSAALGLAGGYGLPKLYDGLSSGLAPAAHPGAVAPAAASTTPAAPAVPAQTQAQAAMATSSGTVDNIAARAAQSTTPPVTGRRVP